MSAIMTKTTCLGSQYPASSCPSVPNPTPAAEMLDSEVIGAPPPMDFAAVANILGPIQESLNESADDAMYPSPPINTPEALSPAPSIVYRNHQPRGRGFSMLSTRLAQLQTDDYRFTHHNFDVASSNRSKEPSVDEDNGGDMDSNIKVLSNGGRDKTALGRASMSLPVLPASPVVEGSVPIALGSPTVNPRIEEYLSFTSKDLPTKAPSACFPSTFVDTALSVSKMATDNESLISRNSFKSDSGVTEQSNWAEELEDCVDRACMRLEQLARDEFITDPSVSVEEYYIARLKRLLGSGKREIPVSIQKMAKPL